MNPAYILNGGVRIEGAKWEYVIDGAPGAGEFATRDEAEAAAANARSSHRQKIHARQKRVAGVAGGPKEG